MKCRVWPPSPYGLVPIHFTEDVWFRGRQVPEMAEIEAATYRSLVNVCREYTRRHSSSMVEFEMKVACFRAGEREEQVGRDEGSL